MIEAHICHHDRRDISSNKSSLSYVSFRYYVLHLLEILTNLLQEKDEDPSVEA